MPGCRLESNCYTPGQILASYRRDIDHSTMRWTGGGGSVNLKVNRKPLRERQIYHDMTMCADLGTCQHKLALYYLQVGKDMPAKDEFAKLPNRPQVLAALTTIDQLLKQGRAVPPRFMQPITHKNVKLWEIKAPQRGNQISRLLAYRESGWSMFLAFAREKKSQTLRDSWKETACDRIKRALKEDDAL